MNHKVEYKIGVLFVSTLLLLTGCSGSKSTESAFNDEAVVSVEVEHAKKELVATGNVYSGVIQPKEEVTIVPKFAGKVVEMELEVGDVVKKGDVLLKLDDKDLQNALKQAVAAESAATANVKSTAASVESGVVQSESGVVQAKGNMVQAETSMIQAENGVTQAQNAVTKAKNAIEDNNVSLEKAESILNDTKTNFDRMKKLFDQSLVSKVEYEQSELALKSAQSSYESLKIAGKNAQATLENAQKSLEAAKQTYTKTTEGYNTIKEGYANAEKLVSISQSSAAVEASQQALEQAKVAVEIAQSNLGDAVLTSPINGIIASKNINVGERVSAQSTVLTIVDLETVKVLTYIPASEINNIHVGQQVQSQTLSFDSTTVGKVKTISPMDEEGKGYPVEIEIPNPDLLLKSGMLVDLQFIDEDAKEEILVPATAVLDENGKSFVFVAIGEHPERKEVETIEKIGSKVVVKVGISEDDLIITKNTSILSSDTLITY